MFIKRVFLCVSAVVNPQQLRSGVLKRLRYKVASIRGTVHEAQLRWIDSCPLSLVPHMCKLLYRNIRRSRGLAVLIVSRVKWLFTGDSYKESNKEIVIKKVAPSTSEWKVYSAVTRSGYCSESL